MIALVLMLAVPTQVPANWACAEAAYGDGAVCDCGCDAPDSDCADGETSPHGHGAFFVNVP